MMLTCPSCTTSYQIPDDAVGASGRKVKCHKCAHVWHATQQASVPAPIAPAPAAMAVAGGEDWGSAEAATSAGLGGDEELGALRDLLDGTGLENSVGNGTHMGQGEKAAPARKKSWRRFRRPGGPAAGPGRKFTAAHMTMVAAVAALIAGGALWLRSEVVTMLPGTARIYAALGYPVNLRGLEFHNVGFETVIENGLPVLAVRGEVVNITNDPVEIPNLSFSLRNHRMQEIYAWTGKPSQNAVAPAGRVSFATRLLAPPIGAEQVRIRFVPGGKAGPGPS